MLKSTQEKYMYGLSISVRVVDQVTILDLVGKILHRDGADDLKDQVLSLIEKGKRNIVLNMAHVVYIDQAGIGELVSGFTTVSSAGGGLKLLALTSRVKDLLQITKLYTVFEVFDDEAKAVASFD